MSFEHLVGKMVLLSDGNVAGPLWRYSDYFICITPQNLSEQQYHVYNLSIMMDISGTYILGEYCLPENFTEELL